MTIIYDDAVYFPVTKVLAGPFIIKQINERVDLQTEKIDSIMELFRAGERKEGIRVYPEHRRWLNYGGEYHIIFSKDGEGPHPATAIFVNYRFLLELGFCISDFSFEFRYRLPCRRHPPTIHVYKRSGDYLGLAAALVLQERDRQYLHFSDIPRVIDPEYDTMAAEYWARYQKLSGE